MDSTYIYKTAAGPLQVTLQGNSIRAAVFIDHEATSPVTEMVSQPVAFAGTPFQIAVWQAACEIPAGKVVSYHDIARTIGRPRAYRAVANALGANKIAYFIPCHRVIRADGGLGGYYWGIDKKIALLRAEGYMP